MKNPFGTKTYGGWGGESPKDPDANLNRGRFQAQAERTLTKCRACKPTQGKFCGKHAAQFKRAL